MLPLILNFVCAYFAAYGLFRTLPSMNDTIGDDVIFGDGMDEMNGCEMQERYGDECAREKKDCGAREGSDKSLLEKDRNRCKNKKERISNQKKTHRYKKCKFIILDGLRYDATIATHKSGLYYNNMPVFEAQFHTRVLLGVDDKNVIEGMRYSFWLADAYMAMIEHFITSIADKKCEYCAKGHLHGKKGIERHAYRIDRAKKGSHRTFNHFLSKNVNINVTDHFTVVNTLFVHPHPHTHHLSIAGIPTSTSTRIESMVTGIPTNYRHGLTTFQHIPVPEDNMVGKFKTVLYGDKMWKDLFPGLAGTCCLESYEQGHNFDDEKKVMKEIVECKMEGFELLVGHLVYLDHYGHKYGTIHHKDIRDVLRTYNDFIRELITGLDDDTLLVVTSDHGVENSGGHGGARAMQLASFVFFCGRGIDGTKDDVCEAMRKESYKWQFDMNEKWIDAKRRHISTTQAAHADRKTGIRPESDRCLSNSTNNGVSYVHQNDIMPTICALLGKAIPFYSTGTFIYELVGKGHFYDSAVRKCVKLYNLINKTEKNAQNDTNKMNYVLDHVKKYINALSFHQVFALNHSLSHILNEKCAGSNPPYIYLGILIGVLNIIIQLKRIKFKQYDVFQVIITVLTCLAPSFSIPVFIHEDILWSLLFLALDCSWHGVFYALAFLKIGKFPVEGKRIGIFELMSKNNAIIFLGLLHYVRYCCSLERTRKRKNNKYEQEDIGLQEILPSDSLYDHSSNAIGMKGCVADQDTSISGTRGSSRTSDTMNTVEHVKMSVHVLLSYLCDKVHRAFRLQLSIFESAVSFLISLTSYPYIHVLVLRYFYQGTSSYRTLIISMLSVNHRLLKYFIYPIKETLFIFYPISGPCTGTKSNIRKSHILKRIAYFYSCIFASNRTMDLCTIDYMTCFIVSDRINVNSLFSVLLYFFTPRIVHHVPCDDIYLLVNSVAFLGSFVGTWWFGSKFGNEYFYGRFFNVGMYFLMDNLVILISDIKKIIW